MLLLPLSNLLLLHRNWLKYVKGCTGSDWILPPKMYLHMALFTYFNQFNLPGVVFQSHLRRTLGYSIVFLQTHNIGNNANFGISGLYHMKRQNSSNKMLSPLSIVPLELWFQVQYFSFWTNLAFACKTETLG